MKKQLLVAIFLFPCFVWADEKSDFQNNFRAIHEKEVRENTLGLEKGIYDMVRLPDSQKKQILNDNFKELKIVQCENSGNFIRLCTFENQVKDPLGGMDIQYNNQIYMRNGADFVNWRETGQKVLDQNCSGMRKGFYQALDNISAQLWDLLSQNQTATPSSQTIEQGKKIYASQKIIQPYFTFNIEQERKVTTYSCLDNNWSKMITYPLSEKLVDGDCHDPNLVQALGIANICSAK